MINVIHIKKDVKAHEFKYALSDCSIWKLHLNKNPTYFTHVKKELYTINELNALWLLKYIPLLLILR